MTIWLALHVDDGVLGAFTTKRDAIATMVDVRPVVHRYAPGGYVVTDDWGDDDDHKMISFDLATVKRAHLDGFEWAVEAWEQAGRPMGRLDEPIPGRED